MNDGYVITREDMARKVNRVLDASGGLYTFDDIMEAIEEGRMQSFTSGDSWIVTQVDHFPRKTVISITLAIGNIDECKAIMPKLEEFAKSVGATRIAGLGREGWWHFAEPGWRRNGVWYEKDL